MDAGDRARMRWMLRDCARDDGMRIMLESGGGLSNAVNAEGSREGLQIAVDGCRMRWMLNAVDAGC